MASLQPQETNRFDRSMSQSITPKKNRTFSENMTRRRKPFLPSKDNSNSSIVYRTPKRNLTQPHKHFGNYKNEVKENVEKQNNSNCELKSATVNLKKIFENNQTIKKVENFSNYSGDLSQISGYYSDGSINETTFFSETSIEDLSYQLEEKFPPLRNSTFIDQAKTHESEILFSLNETESEYKTSHFENNLTNGQTKTDLNEAIQKIDDSGILSSSTPLIIIDEFDAFGNISKNDNEVSYLNEVTSIPQFTENEIKSLKTLNESSLNPQRSESNETRKLKAKLKQMKLFNQIEIKNKVMTQIMELSRSATSPKLKHYCNKCERKNNGSMVTSEMKINAKEEGYDSFFWYIWSTIKYPFVNLTKKPEKEQLSKTNSNKRTHKKTNNDKEGAKDSFLKAKNEKLNITTPENKTKTQGEDEIKVKKS